MQGFPHIKFSTKEKVYVDSISFNGKLLSVGDLILVNKGQLAIKVDFMFFQDGRFLVGSEDNFETYSLNEIEKVNHIWKKVVITKTANWYSTGEKYYVFVHINKKSETYTKIPHKHYLIKKEDCKDAEV